MSKKLITSIFILFFLIATQTAFAGDKVVRIKFAYAGTKFLPGYVPIVEACEKIKERTKGKYQITIYPGRQLGSDRDAIDLTRTGAIEMISTSLALFDKFTPAFNAFQMPFLIKNYEMLKKIYVSDLTKKIAFSVMEPLNLHFLSMSENGLRGLANNVRTINTPKDLKGLRFRVAANKMHTDMLSALGAIPVPIAYGEIYGAIKTGVIDGSEINATSASSEKLMEVIKYFSLTKHFFWPGIIYCNNNFWNTLPPDVKKIFEEVWGEYPPRVVDRVHKMDLKARKVMKERGIEVIYPDTKPFLDKVRPFYEEYMSKDPRIAEFVEAVRKMDLN